MDNEEDYDIEAMEFDKRRGNFTPGSEEDYLKTNIVRMSLINGQFTQAREQCKEYGLNYMDLYQEFKSL